MNVVGLESGVQDITAGDMHTCAIVAGGGRCWGDNRYGQLGVGSTESRYDAGTGGFTGSVQDVDAGSAHLRRDGSRRAEVLGPQCLRPVGQFTIGSQSLLPVNVIVPTGIAFLPQVSRQELVTDSSKRHLQEVILACRPGAVAINVRSPP